jgi:hypothetical protein
MLGCLGELKDAGFKQLNVLLLGELCELLRGACRCRFKQLNVLLLGVVKAASSCSTVN